MKGYTVFNAEQIDGLPAHFYATEVLKNSDILAYPVRCQSRSRVRPVAAVEFFIRGG